MKNVAQVAVLSQLPPPVHGSTMVTETLISTLEGANCSVRLIDRRFSKSVDSVGRFEVKKVFSAFGLLIRSIRELSAQPQVLIVFLSSSPFAFLADLVVCTIARISRVPVVSYVHTVGFSELAARGPLWNALVIQVLRGSAQIITLGESLTWDLSPFVEPGRIGVIANTAPMPRFTASPRVGNQVLFLSNLIPAKGALDFVSAAQLIAEQIEDADFVIAGATHDADHLQEVHEHIDRVGLSGKIRVVGAVSGLDKWRLLAASRVLLFPSRYPKEAQPLSVIEAAAVGTPCVAYDSGGLRDIISEGISGALVPVGDVAMLAQRAVEILAHPELAGERESRTKNEFTSRFAREIFDRSWLETVGNYR